MGSPLSLHLHGHGRPASGPLAAAFSPRRVPLLLPSPSPLLFLGVCVCGGSLSLWRCFPKTVSGCFSSESCPSTRILWGPILSQAFSGTEGPTSVHQSVLPGGGPRASRLTPHHTPFPALYRSLTLEKKEKHETRAHTHPRARDPREGLRELLRTCARALALRLLARQLMTSRRLDPAFLAASTSARLRK